jgi:hypothetical protein
VSASSGGSSCDLLGDCQTCLGCSLGAECASQANACQNEPDCAAYFDCASTCANANCWAACSASHPLGEQLYAAAVTCALCQACPNDCAAESGGQCGP